MLVAFFFVGIHQGFGIYDYITRPRRHRASCCSFYGAGASPSIARSALPDRLNPAETHSAKGVKAPDTVGALRLVGSFCCGYWKPEPWELLAPAIAYYTQ